MTNQVFNVTKDSAALHDLNLSEGFDPCEINEVIENYVCSICNRNLIVLQVIGENKCYIKCPKHGNVEFIGRIRNSTVEIDNERASKQFYQVIRNLPDLWGELIPPEPDDKTVARVQKDLGY